MTHNRGWTGVLLGAALLCGWVRPFGSDTAAPRTPSPDFTSLALWHIAGQGRGRPVVHGDAVYFLSKGHEVLAVDTVSGALRWRRRTGEPGTTTMGTSIVATGSVLVAGDYNLVAFARDSGVLRWRFTPHDGYAPGIYLGEAADDVVFAGSPSGRLYAIDGESGAERWSSSSVLGPAETVFQPIVVHDLVVAAYTTFSAPNAGGVAAYDRHSGAEKWRTPFVRGGGANLPAGSGGGPVAVNDLVIAASADGTIHAFDQGNGRIRWSIPTAAQSGESEFRPLATAGRTLAAGSLSGCVTAYDLGTRVERWRYCDRDGASVAFAIACDDRNVYVPYYEGRLIAIDIDSGKERWRIGGGPDSGFNWLPAVDGDRLYVGASTAGFFAFRRP
ncbi:MAG: PQQ-binding-like beta-propeller repeat protein [Acidobacteriota bacterium]